MAPPLAWNDPEASARAIQLLEGAAPYQGLSDEIEFSRGTWRRKRAASETVSSKLPSAAEAALSRSQKAVANHVSTEHTLDGDAAVFRRTWTDIDFDGGQHANRRLVQALETEFTAQLASNMQNSLVANNAESGGATPRALAEALSTILGTNDTATVADSDVLEILGRSDNLGASLDMIGVYLKNYMTDRADLVLRRVMPLCRQRGGFWLIKALNIVACVCSKQGRHKEALEALEELDALVRERLAELGGTELEAWAFYDMVYKNFGWTLEALGRHAEAFEYFERAVEIKRANDVAPTWFDQWDIGKTLARMAYEEKHAGELSRAGGVLLDALKLQQETDADDSVTRGKLLKSNGECCIALGDLSLVLEEKQAKWAEAESFHRECRSCFQMALGPSNPLTGAASEDLAGVLMRLRRWPEARDMLHQAFHCECVKDIIELPKVAELVDALLAVHCAMGDSSRPVRACYETDLQLGLANLRRRRIDELQPAGFAAVILKGCWLAGPRGDLLQEATACLQVLWEQGPEYWRDASDSFRVFQCDVSPAFLPPRAAKQDLQVNLRVLLEHLKSEIRALRAQSCASSSSAAACSSDHDVGPSTEFVALD